MAQLLKGKEVADAMCERLAKEAASLKEKGITPTLVTFRVGEREDDIAYEKAAVTRAAKCGVETQKVVLPADVTQEAFDAEWKRVNVDPQIHGILLFAPLPAQLDMERARQTMKPEKDVDGITLSSLAGVFTNTQTGFAPCTAEAVMALLHHYGIEISGKKAAVIGRSLVIGRPVGMLLMHENATVVNCHTRTKDVQEITRQADILICAAGQMHSVTEAYTNPEQTVIDVGIHWDEEAGKLTGDADFARVEPQVRAVTPVPGGVGSVTSSVLIKHVIESAARSCP